MKNEHFTVDHLEFLSNLQRIVLESTDRDQALINLTQSSHEALNSQVSALSSFDSQNQYLRFEFLAGPHRDLKRYLVRQQIPRPNVNRNNQERPKLFTTSSGKSALPLFIIEDIAELFGLKVLSCEIKSGPSIAGYLHSFSEVGLPPGPEERLLTILARQAELIFEKFDPDRTRDDSFKFLNSLLQEALWLSPSDFLKRVSQKACELLSTPICIVWQRDESDEKLRIAATTGDVDDEFKQLELTYDMPGIRRFLTNRKVAYVLDLTRPQQQYLHTRQARARGWSSIMSAPMWVGDKLIGILDVYTTRRRLFHEQERNLFNAFANQAALSIQKAELLRETVELKEREKQSFKNQVIAEIQKTINKVSSVSNSGPGGDFTETLNLVAEKCASATNAKTCFIRLWDINTASLRLKAFQVEPSYQGPEIQLDHQVKLGEGISGYVAQSRETLNCGDTSQTPEHSRFYGALGIHSVLCVPIKSGDAVLGTISVGHYSKSAFHDEERHLLENLVESLAISIERANLMDCLLSLEEATMQSESLDKLLERLATFTQQLMREQICLVWLLDRDHSEFSVKAHALTPDNPEEQTPREDPEQALVNQESADSQKIRTLRELRIASHSPDVTRFFDRTEPLYLEDAGKVETHFYADTIKEFGWKSMLSMPLKFRRRVIGILEIYSQEVREFTDLQRRQFKILAFQASGVIESRERLECLTQVTQALTECRDEDKLTELILDGALEIAGTDRGWISRLNLRTGELDIKVHRGELKKKQTVALGEGVTGMALKKATPIRLADVSLAEYKYLYTASWSDTHSVLAVPILINEAEIRVKRQIQLGQKLIGVINLESPAEGAFSQADENAVLSLSRIAAANIEKLEFDRKLARSREVDSWIVGEPDWDKTIQTILETIKESLSFEYVLVSKVNLERREVKTEYLCGIPEPFMNDFKKRTSSPADVDDFKLRVAREGEIEVPVARDSRIDEVPYAKAGLKSQNRVFIPISASPDDQERWVVEAGCSADYSPAIYDRDVQILKDMVGCIARALDLKKRGLLPRITHEFTAPIVGIRSHASFLEHRLESMSRERIQRKLRDILADCDQLLLQTGRLTHLLGGKAPSERIELVPIYCDIIIKTIKQLTPMVETRGFNPQNVLYDHKDTQRIRLYVNKEKISSAVTNLLINSIKYAEDEPARFKIEIGLEENMYSYVFTFKDWGIGIKPKYQAQIFAEGFRTPEACEMNVIGSGLGLHIARKVMQELGGDLRLIQNRKPTEFHMILPKSLREAPK